VCKSTGPLVFSRESRQQSTFNMDYIIHIYCGTLQYFVSILMINILCDVTEVFSAKLDNSVVSAEMCSQLMRNVTFMSILIRTLPKK
jgi:hypothetical protein